MRVCLVGQGQVGKTSLVSLFVTSEHIHTFDASLGELVNIHFNNNKARMSYSCERLVCEVIMDKN